jgi:hypothetical protein
MYMRGFKARSTRKELKWRCFERAVFGVVHHGLVCFDAYILESQWQRPSGGGFEFGEKLGIDGRRFLRGH